MQRTIEFWTSVRHLAQSYDEQGALSDERAAKIVAAFEQLPPDTQQHLLTDMLRIATDMPDIYTMVVAAANVANNSDLKLSAG